MEKEPWEEKIVKEENQITRKAKLLLLNTHWLTAILSLFFVIMLIILFIVFYTSNRGGNKVTETSGFYKSSVSTNAKKSTKKSSTPDSTAETETSTTTDQAAETEPTQEETQVSNGDTIVVLAGEGAGSIAARAGISVAQLQQLNPSHMTQGYWYANPGDAVYIN